ncbi:thiamine pyrophosphate-dependent dehydrogenase E1 component subunit alpha [Ferrimonas marina]|uniref:2-oxoisovalerate dehydrogenase subunit alpha n=1 Tax=Ferrimonas marina TaxID=299255 RepID=A0A1M5Z3P1_9GAMM|nr:thiamine pyrophosphate-dependent dehydrogenase E1 component subunit alpha [Ferrimonas marina]SHI18819.1 2-oxoisovalerate dehydrogenase E1 component alpha subunit [Ferrimonas marina]
MTDNTVRPQAVYQAHLLDGQGSAIPTLKVLQADGSLYPDATLPTLDRDTALKIYRSCVFTRVLDERMLAAQRQGRISFYMTCTGEEAAVLGAAAALEQEDMIMAQYREHAALHWRGFTTEQFMNQMFSNEKDLGKGRQMPIHYGSRALHYMTISSPLGTQIPQAAGYAYGQKMQGQDRCTLCFFGEGAASEGDFHAGLNMAAVHKAPAIFFCRNNGYAISTPTSEQYAGDGIAPRGLGYGIKSIRVDGNDMLAVLAATQLAREVALREHCPVLIEAMTYRLGAHSSSDDPSGYRSKEEEARWQEHDPVRRFKLWLLAQQWWSEGEDEALYQAYRDEVLAAVKVAEKLAKPALDTLVTDVYDQVPEHLQQQLDEVQQQVRRYPEHYPITAGREQ